MPRYLIDVNLPYRFSLWAGGEFLHVRDLGETMSDSDIWRYAATHDLIIVSKDADFSDRVLVTIPPPRVVHIRYGNMKMREFHNVITRQWPEIHRLTKENRLVRVFEERIETVG
jgi:predicted nuclease of predicted toxin-antitoxin system